MATFKGQLRDRKIVKTSYSIFGKQTQTITINSHNIMMAQKCAHSILLQRRLTASPSIT